MISNQNKSKILEIEKNILRNSLLLKKTEKLSSQIAWIRFYVFAIGVFIFLLLFFISRETEAIITLGIFSIAFIIVSKKQIQILKIIKKQKTWILIKKNNLARAKLNWDEIPIEKLKNNFDKSPLEIDLDLSGERSLHRLIDLSKSYEGSLLLNDFFVNHDISKDDIFLRQNIVKELVGLSHFRERFLLESNLSSNKEIEAGTFLEWLSKSNKSLIIKKKLLTLIPLCFINLLFIFFALLDVINGLWGITFLIYSGYYLLNQRIVKSLATESDILNDELRKVIRVFEFVENYNFGKNRNISELCSPLTNKQTSPSNRLKKINNVITALSFRNHPVIWTFAILIFPLDYYLAYRIEIYKSQLIELLPEWLSVRNKLEVFISLANYAYLNPDNAYPELIEGDNQIYFKADKLGHPLIPFDQKKRNNYELNSNGSISIITGSNMSGKSTFLRTVGINVCLAYAGVPVDAKYMSLGMMKLFTCIKVSDSIVDGISYFYAEVQRLKQLIQLFEKENKYPILFLIDEIFKGTNNRERLIGSRSMIKALVDKKGAGLISTHDLELIHLAEENPSIKNFHFKEEISGGKMIFDYTLREGPCPSTNALEIMRANGLPVE